MATATSETVATVSDVPEDDDGCHFDANALTSTGGMNASDEQQKQPEEQPDEPEATSDDLLADLIEAESACAVAETEVEIAKGELKEAKATFDNCVGKLRQLVREAKNDAARPLFAKPRQEEAQESDVNPDAWRSGLITELGLWPGITSTLIANNITRVGQLEDLRAEIAQGKAKWPKGIGPAKITLIEDAVLDWLAGWRCTHSEDTSVCRLVRE
jgi:hypothetical protein